MAPPVDARVGNTAANIAAHVVGNTAVNIAANMAAAVARSTANNKNKSDNKPTVKDKAGGSGPEGGKSELESATKGITTTNNSPSTGRQDVSKGLSRDNKDTTGDAIANSDKALLASQRYTI